MTKTTIDWANYSFNPIKGYCPNTDCEIYVECYSHKQYDRFKRPHSLRLDEKELNCDMTNKSGRIFVCSMIELFHPEISKRGWTSKVLHKINSVNESNFYLKQKFILLTKRPDEARYMLLPKGIWLGTSITGLDKHKDVLRMKHLLQCNARVKFLSIEPLLGEMNHISFDGISWIIIGGLTPFPRHEQSWIDDIIERAREKLIPIFLKRNANYHTKIMEFPA